MCFQSRRFWHSFINVLAFFSNILKKKQNSLKGLVVQGPTEWMRSIGMHTVTIWICDVGWKNTSLIWHNEIVWPYVMMLTFKRKTVVADNPNKFKPVPLVTRYCYSHGFGQMNEWVSAEFHVDMKWNMLNLFRIPTLNLIGFIT